MSHTLQQVSFTHLIALTFVSADQESCMTVPKEIVAKSNVTVASLFFTAVFGRGRGVKGLNILIAASAFGNIISVIIGSSRVVRECGRYEIFSLEIC